MQLYDEAVLLKSKIQNMKKETATPESSFNLILKFFGQLFKTLFVNSDNREFQRLKNFIAS